MSNIILPNDYSQMMYESYGATNDATGFIVDQTNLFRNMITDEPYMPYKKQVHFLNLLRPQDKVVVVLKIRQCVAGDTLVYTESGLQPIRQMFENNYRGKTKSISNNKAVEDEIIDIWSTGIKDVYTLYLHNGLKIKCTKDHKINTVEGFKTLAELKQDEEIICQHFTKFKSLGNRVKKIVYSGQEETYDMTTKYHHSYLANGIHVHNSGFSTSIVGRVCYQAYFGQCNEVAIVSASRTQADKVLDRIKKTFNSMSEDLRPEFVRDNQSMLELKNGVKIYSLSSNPDTARGITGDVFLDEYGVVGSNDSYQLWSALYPTISLGGRIIAVSTPKGRVGKFFDLSTKSLAEISGGDVRFESVRYRVSIEDVPHQLYARDHLGLFDGMSVREQEQEFGLTFFDDSDESYMTEDFLMQKLVEKERDIPLYRCYEDFGVPHEHEYDADRPIEEKYYIANNPDYKHLIEAYSSFIGGYDPASVNDDSAFVIEGIRRDDPEKRDAILEIDMKTFDSDVIIQAKHAIKISKCFNLESLAVDYTGIGRGVGDYMKSDDFMEDILELFIYKNSAVKVDGFIKLKTSITNNKLKRRYEGSKDDKYKLKQFTNIYYENNKMVGKGGKDDFANAYMLCEMASIATLEAGIFFI